METLLATQWIAQFAERLHGRWKTIDRAVLEEVAMDLWKRTEYRVMSPCEAADLWLNPITPDTPGDVDNPTNLELLTARSTDDGRARRL